ncbi:MAG: hypothetical protein KDD60_03730 [Bdellovibrionales bacterium]|nr:hypothetical protein [Bdellovibrionales bacterium]
MRDQFIRTLLELAKEDPNIILVTGDLGFAVFDEFQRVIPNQFVNAGVAEQNMTGLAAGLAMAGKRVFTYSIGNFVSLRCLEQIRNDVCYHGVPVTAVCIGAGFSYGALGVSHHATEDLAIMRSLPNLDVYSPGTISEVDWIVRDIVSRGRPAYLRLDKSAADFSDIEVEPYRPAIPRLVREGGDLTFIATGGILGEALRAAEILEDFAVSARILNVHTLKPLDFGPILKAAEETHGIVTIEEHSTTGGLGGLVAEGILESGIPLKFFRRIGLKSSFSSVVGSQQYLRARYGLDAAAIAAVVKSAYFTTRSDSQMLVPPSTFLERR